VVPRVIVPRTVPGTSVPSSAEPARTQNAAVPVKVLSRDGAPGCGRSRSLRISALSGAAISATEPYQ